MMLNSGKTYKFYEKINLKKNIFEKINLLLEDEKKIAELLNKKVIIENKIVIGLYLVLFLIFLIPQITYIVIGRNILGEIANKLLLASIIILGVISFVQAIINREKALKITTDKSKYKFSFNAFYLKLFKIIVIVLYLIGLNYIWMDISIGYDFYDIILTGLGKGSKVLLIANILIIIFLICYNIYYFIIGKFVSSGFNNLGEAVKKGKLDEVKESISVEAASEIFLGSTYSIIFKELSVLVNKLEELSELESEELIKRTETIANASHDIKTPLTSIKNYIYILENKKIKDCDKEKYIDILKDKILELESLIQNLKIATEVYKGELEPKFKKINISKVISDVLEEYEVVFKEKNIEVIKNNFIEENLNLDLEFNKTIFRNVFSNISKYSLENSRVFIEAEKVKEDYIEYLKISIKNYSKEKLEINLEELFQRFKRGDSSRTTEGNGLGLDIIRNLVRLQEGKVYINIDGDQFELVIKYVIY